MGGGTIFRFYGGDIELMGGSPQSPPPTRENPGLSMTLAGLAYRRSNRRSNRRSSYFDLHLIINLMSILAWNCTIMAITWSLDLDSFDC